MNSPPGFIGHAEMFTAAEEFVPISAVCSSPIDEAHMDNLVLHELAALSDDDVRSMDKPHLVETLLKVLGVVRATQKRHMGTEVMSCRSLQDVRVTAKSTHELRKEVDEEGSKMLNQYLVLDDLGRGSCGKVKLAFDTERNVTVAIKIVRKPSGSAFHYASQESIRREIAVMKKLRHRHIVALLEVIDDPAASKMYIVMQHIDNGAIGKVQPDLTCKAIAPKALLKYARQITAGLEYLHRHRICHRDIKPENILVNVNGEAFLADFGVSEMMGGKKGVQGKSGTLLFMSPELLRDREADGYAVDMWALGVTLWGLLVGKLPFASEAEILDMNFMPELKEDHRSAMWAPLLRQLLDRNSATRMTAKEAHRFVKAHQNDEDEELESAVFSASEADMTSAVTEVATLTRASGAESSGGSSLAGLGQSSDDEGDGVTPIPVAPQTRSPHRNHPFVRFTIAASASRSPRQEALVPEVAISSGETASCRRVVASRPRRVVEQKVEQEEGKNVTILGEVAGDAADSVFMPVGFIGTSS